MYKYCSEVALKMESPSLATPLLKEGFKSNVIIENELGKQQHEACKVAGYRAVYE